MGPAELHTFSLIKNLIVWLGIFPYLRASRQKRPTDKTADVPSHTNPGKKRNGQSDEESEPEPHARTTPLTEKPGIAVGKYESSAY